MYELMVIAKSDRSDEVFRKVEKFLKDIDAVSVKAEKLGKKILAYPIAKQTEADYFLYNFEAETQTLKALSDKIRLEQENILRYMLVKVAKAPKESKSSSFAKASEDKQKVVEPKEEEVKVKPRVTVTTRTKVSPADAKALAGRQVAKVKESLFLKNQKAKVAKVKKVSKVTKVAKVSKDKKGKKNN